MTRTPPVLSIAYGPMNNWLDSRWMNRLAGVPPMLSGRMICRRSGVIS